MAPCEDRVPVRLRSLPRVLARRETRGRVRNGDIRLVRKKWKIDQVMAPEECSVLLGFSSDGNFLLYYSIWESAYEVQWERVDPCSSAPKARMDVALRLDAGTSVPVPFTGPTGNGSSLRIWQTVDDAVVVTLLGERHLASQDSGQSYHIAVSPSPYFSDTQCAGWVEYLRFSYTLPTLTQSMESWQMVSLGNHIYHLVLNMSTAILILEFFLHHSVMAASSETGHPQKAKTQFNQSDWYKPPEFPVEFRENVYRRSPTSTTQVTIKCQAQQQFDIEAFLGYFLNKYAAFRHFYLVDYDLRLVRASVKETIVFLCCAADLESSPTDTIRTVQHARLGLSLAFHVYSGECEVIRALRIPRTQTLRQVATVLERTMKTDLDHRLHPGRSPTELNNDPVLRGKSLTAIHNPQYPVSIYFPNDE